MSKKLYIGNLSYQTTEESLRNYFAGFGTVESAQIVKDRESGNSKGFGFVEMSLDDEAAAAIQEANGKPLDGRTIRVNEAMDKPRRDSRGGGGGGDRRYNSW
ncbi:MAG: RNA-binding protein [Spirochaetaceae bacterium]|jgi:RNA recognition motif-containing protein|nr:RNA-binding protein [Spirochaetaceae bacterium]